MELKHMVIGAVIIGLIIILILPGGGLLSGEPEVMDCGSDMDCFVEAAADCSPANVLQLTDMSATSMSINGLQGGMCEIDVRVDSVNSSTTILQAYPPELQGLFLSWAGKEMKCLVPMSGETYDPTNLTQYCEGELKESMVSTSRAAEAFYNKVVGVNPACVNGTLWSYEYSDYVVHGVIGDECHATYSFEVPPITGRFYIDHYFNKDVARLDINYPQAVQVDDIKKMCNEAFRWNYRDNYGFSLVTSSSVAQDEENSYCHLIISINPLTPYLPAAMADVYVSQTGDTLILVETTDGASLEKAYAPV